MTCTVPVPSATPGELRNAEAMFFSGSVCNVSAPMTPASVNPPFISLSRLVRRGEKWKCRGRQTQRTGRPIAAAGARVDATRASTSGEVAQRSRAPSRGFVRNHQTATFADQPVLLRRGSLDGKEVKNENLNSPDEKFQNLTNKYQPNTT